MFVYICRICGRKIVSDQSKITKEENKKCLHCGKWPIDVDNAPFCSGQCEIDYEESNQD